MSNSSADNPLLRAEQLAQRMLDGGLTDAEHAELLGYLQQDGRARDHLLDQSYLHAVLRERFLASQPSSLTTTLFGVRPEELSQLTGGLSDAVAAPRGFQPDPAPLPQNHPILISLRDIFFRGTGAMSRAAAAVLLIGSLCLGALVAMTVTMSVLKTPAQARHVVMPTYVAQLTAAHNLHWTNEATSPMVDQLLAEGQAIEILSGCAEITFTSGVRVVLEGPASLDLQSAESARLDVGRLTVELSAPSTKFAVNTPTCQMVDLGAEFGVQVESAGDAEVHVLAGAVEVRPVDAQGKATTDSERLETGQAMRLSSRGVATLMTAVAGNFVRDLGARAAPPEDPFRVMAWYRLGEDDARAQEDAKGPLSFDRAGVRHLRPSSQLITVRDTVATGSSLATFFNGKTQILAGDVLPGRPTDNFGIEAWIKSTSVGGSRVVAYYGNTCTSGWGIVMVDDLVCGLLGGATFDIGRVSIPNNRWTHVALVRSEGRSTFYVDGVAAGTTSTWSGQTPSGRFMIGGESLQRNQYFHGEIDDVRVFRFPPGGFNSETHLSCRRKE